MYAASMEPRNLDRGPQNLRGSYTSVLLQGHSRGFQCNDEAPLCDRRKRVTGVTYTRCSHRKSSNWRFSRTEFHPFTRASKACGPWCIAHTEPSFSSRLSAWPHSKMIGWIKVSDLMFIRGRSTRLVCSVVAGCYRVATHQQDTALLLLMRTGGSLVLGRLITVISQLPLYEGNECQQDLASE